MGLLVDGKWVDEWYDTKKSGGKFVRQESQFRDFIGSKKFAPQDNRYHLYISHACPWANRANIMRKLKGLDKIIPVTIVDALMAENGWELRENGDFINKKKFLHEIYTLADPKFNGRVTVPVLWDKQEKTIVNNESSEIIRIFNSSFNEMTGNDDDYYPQDLRTKIDEINNFVYESINNGVYKAGFATSQEVYDDEVSKLFYALDILEDTLDKQRYLVGNVLTEADIRLFTTLIRFDAVYVGHFKCNIQRIADYHNLTNYVRDLYQIDGFGDTINMTHIKKHYYMSHKTVNPTGIVPIGPDLDFDESHDRGRFSI